MLSCLLLSSVVLSCLSSFIYSSLSICLLSLSLSVSLSVSLCDVVLCCVVLCESACGVCGTNHSQHGVSVQARADMELIGWQNAWEQAPGVPATPSPPQWQGSPKALSCVHGPKNTQRPSRHLSLNNDRHANHNRTHGHQKHGETSASLAHIAVSVRTEQTSTRITERQTQSLPI